MRPPEPDRCPWCGAEEAVYWSPTEARWCCGACKNIITITEDDLA